MQIHSEKYSIVKNKIKAAPPGEVQAFHLNVRASTVTLFQESENPEIH